MELRSAILFLLLLVFTDISYSAAPACKIGCSGQNNNVLKLQEGTIYVYNLEGNTETSIPKTTGPNGESTKLNIRAKVEVSVQPKCATLIKLKTVQIIGPDDKKYGSLNKLEENPLRVSLNGGALSPQICTVPEDDYTSLNIKRAVASLLQLSSAESSTVPNEVDVFGSCPTAYDVHHEGDATVIRKTRDLNKCAYRENIRQEIFSIPTSGNSELQSSPLLDPTFEAEIRVKGGVVESAIAHESYLLRPFAEKTNGARTKVTTKLTLESKSAGAVPDSTKEPRSIIFENPHEVVSSSIQTVQSALHKVVDNNVPIDAARNVAELVAIIRRASADDLLSVYGQVKAGAGFKNKALAKKVFTDALFRSGSGDSIAVAVELLKSREIVDNDAKLWYLSFALARHASSSALEKAASLLDDGGLPKEAYLGIGALAGKYCREHLCENVPQFEALLGKLASPLSKPVPANRKEENKLVGSLKSIRNVKHLTEDVAVKVAAIIKEAKAPARVRAAALDTAISDACKNKLQKAASDVLNNREEDSELRIKAYLVLVECPNPKTANKLSEFIETETVNQVGAFITSHLRNLRASAKPDRQAARAILENVKPRRRFPFDIRKFSQNYELSYDVDALGSSASLDSNVIFSQKSYIPRSANLNLTAEVFGHAFNLFEITGRAENLERVVERYLGPKGYVRTTKPEDIFKDGKSELKTLKEHIEKKYKSLSRSRRSVTRENINSFGEKVHLSASELDDNIDVDVSLRLLGNELIWVNLGEKTATTPENVIDKIAAVLERGFGQAKNFDQRVQEHSVFLDTELAYPTATGLPIKLTATGTSVVHLKVAGSLDLAALLKNPKNGQAKIEIRPSASVEVIGKLSVDGYAVEAGLKVAATLHTHTGTEISVKLLDGEGIDINVGLPIKESDILTVSTEVLVAVRERGQVQVATPLDFQVPRKDYQGCFDQLMPIVGLTLCGKVGFPNDATPLTSGAALYPLNGHSKLSLHLDKEDESLTTYHFRLQYSLKDPTHRRIEALVDTPGSSNPREISVLAELKTVPHLEANLKMVTPLYKLHTQALVTNTDSEYSLSGLLDLQDVFSYKARLGLLINGATYTPILEYTPIGGADPAAVKVEGTVTVDKAGDKRTYKFNNVRVVTKQGHLSLDGTLSKGNNLFATDLKIGYDKENVLIKTKLQRQGDKNLKLNAEVLPSQYPDFGIGIKYEYQRDKTHVENSLSIVHGRDLASTQSKISIFQQITYNVESIHRFDVSTKNSLTYPLFGVEGKLEGAATASSVHYDLLVGYEKNTITSKLNAKTGITKPRDYEVDFSVAILDHGLRIEAKRDIIAANKSKFRNTLVLTPGGTYALDADVTHQLDKNNIDTRLEAELKLDGAKDSHKLDVGVIFNPSTLEVHSKISTGSEDLLDSEIKHKRTEPTSGSFRLNIRHAIESNGDYKHAEKKTNANVIINIIPIARKIKGAADLTVTGVKHVGTIEILTDADKDPSKKLLIKTDTDLSGKSINSKNKIQVVDKEVIVNFNGEVHGKPGNGGVSGGYDITLPNGVHLVARGKQGLNIVPSNSNGELFLELGYSLKEGEALTKFTLDTSARNVDLKRYSFDTKFDATYHCGDGDASYKQVIKSTPSDGKWLVELQNSLGGTHLGKYQYNGKTKATLSKSEVSYHATASVGESYSADVQGKIHPGIEDKTTSIEQTITIKTPAENAKEVKLVSLSRYTQGEGARPCQLKDIQELVINGKSYKLSVEAQGTKKEGNLKGAVAVTGGTPYAAQIRYKHNHENEIIKSELTLEASEGSNNVVNVNVKADYTKSLALLNTQVTGTTPFEKAKKFDLALNYKRVSRVSGNAQLKLHLNDDTADLGSKWDFTTDHILLDSDAAINGEKYRVYFKNDRKNERLATSEGQIAWANNGGGVYDWSATVDLESLENFLIVVKLNCEKLNLNKVKIELGNRPTKSGAAKKVNLNVTNKDGKQLSGSASYAIKESETGFSVEGKGTVTVSGETFPLVYKLSSNRLSKNVNNEVGNHMIFTIDYGKGKYLQDAKVTDKEIKSLLNFCHDKKCLNQELLIVTQNLGIGKSKSQFIYKNTNELEFIPKYNFGVSHIVDRDGILGHTDTSINVRDVIYSIKSHVKRTDAGIVITVPTREIALISNYQFVEQKKENSVVKVDASLWLDRKKNPNEKATLTLESGLNILKELATVTGSAKFTHPSLSRDLVVKGDATADLSKTAAKANLEIDVLNKKSQKFILTAEVEQNIIGSGRNYTAKAGIISKGLTLDIGGNAHAYGSKDGGSLGSFVYYVNDKNLKQDVGILVAASSEKLTAFLRVPGHTLINGEAHITKTSVDGELTIAEGETAVLKATIKGRNEISASLSPKSNPKRAITALLSATSEKLEIRSERIENDKKEILFFGVLHLDEVNLFQIDYDISAENIKKSVKYFEHLAKDLIDRIKAIAESVSKEFNAELTNLAETLKKAQPNLKALIQSYENAFKAIREELEKDKAYQALAAIFQKAFGGILDVVEANIKIIVRTYEQIAHEVLDIQGKLVDIYKKISPDVIKAFNDLLNILSDVIKKLMGLGFKTAEQWLEIIRQNEKDLKLVINNIAESLRDIGRIVIKTVNQLRKEIYDVVNLLLDQVRALPIYSNAKERINELINNLEVPPYVLELVDELSLNIQDVMPTQELKDFAKAVFTYIEKRLKRQPVDDAAELSALAKQLVHVVEGLIKQLKDYLGITGLDSKVIPILGYNLALPLPATSILRLPELGNMRFSPLSLLAAINELPSPLDFYFTYRPRINPLEQIPPFKAYGLILNSHHFLTFDKKQYPFTGTCSYILAQDFKDGNFSIIANLDNGKLRSLTIADKTDVVELLSDSTVIVNGKAGEFPVHTDEVSGWRRYSSVNLKLKAGVVVTRYLPLDIIVIRVSGFYFGRTRGLLGTINNEIYDEYTLPNGQLAKNSGEFANAYQLTQCAAAHEHKSNPPHAPECTTLFTSDSSLRNYFGFLSPEAFREACDHHVAMSKDAHKAACEVAAAYVTALQEEGSIFVTLPSECAKCTVGGKQLELGQSEQVAAPVGKVDIVLVVEQSEKNGAVFKELITPLIATLATDFKERSLPDVEFAVIGYGGPNQKWPQHYGNNGKVTYEGKSDNIQFGDTERLLPPYDTILKKIKLVQNYIEIELGKDQLVTAMNEANRYPFRQGAAKIVILINTTPCTTSPTFPFSLQVPRTINVYRYYREHGLNYFQITPLAGLELEKADGKPKNIVGFDSEKVYYLSEKKKIEGNAEDRAGLKYKDDLCLSFSQFYGGAAFSSQNLLDAKPDQKKKFVEVTSQRIVNGALKYSNTEDCTCSLKLGLIPATECTVASREFKGR